MSPDLHTLTRNTCHASLQPTSCLGRAAGLLLISCFCSHTLQQIKRPANKPLAALCILALFVLKAWCRHLGWLFPGWQSFFAWGSCCVSFVQSFTSEQGAQGELWDIVRLQGVQWLLQVQEASSTKIFTPGWGNYENQRRWKSFNIALWHNLLCMHAMLLCYALFVICFSTSWHVWIFLIPSMTWNVLWEGYWLLRYRDSRTWNSNPVCCCRLSIWPWTSKLLTVCLGFHFWKQHSSCSRNIVFFSIIKCVFPPCGF